MTGKKKIIFRADADNNIGYGHFFRTLALADILKDDFECVFMTINPNEFQKSELKKVCKYEILTDGERHFNILLSSLNGNEIVVLDNYYFSTDFQRSVKDSGSKVVCFHSIHGHHYIADLVISQFLTSKESFSAEPYTKLCLGFNWVLLREPFIEAAIRNKDRQRSPRIEKIVICFGGADKYNLAERTIKILSGYERFFQIDAIVGNNFQHGTSYGKNVRLNLFKNISSAEIAGLFSACDLSIVSASMVCIEALACHTLVAAGYYVDNQVETYKFLNDNKFVIGLGNYLEIDNNILFKCLNDSYYPTKKFSTKYDLSNIKSRYIRIFNEL